MGWAVPDVAVSPDSGVFDLYRVFPCIPWWFKLQTCKVKA